MNSDVLQNHHDDLKNNQKPLYDLSEATGDRPPKRHALKQNTVSGKIMAVAFDTVRKKWFPYEDGHNSPCTVDALYYAQDGNTYMIEFKVGQNAHNVLRKAYDTALLLIEMDKIPVQQLREKYTYITVSSNVTKIDRRFAAPYEYLDKPWDKEEYQKFLNETQEDKNYKNFLTNSHLKDITGIVIAKAYLMHPDMFEDFVQFEHWE